MASAFRGCRACQRRVLDAFTSVAGHPLAAARAPVRSPIARGFQNVSRPGERTFTTWFTGPKDETKQNKDDIPPLKDQQVEPEPPIEQSTSTPSETPDPSMTTSTDPHIPWYLQVQPPTPLSPSESLAPNLAAQEIPPLPANSPAILPSLLNHLSISIGLDHLTILDLRDLSPPSALGANLIMILGTARSEKHLNTSADRFCRWLRNTYKLRPFADGLLGRQELKLKLRRRNKKMKLAQSVGNTLYDGTKGYDDGITTGWICCNVGPVDGVKMPGDEDDVTAEAQDEEQVQDEEMHPVYSAKDQERILEDEAEYKNPADAGFQYRGFGSASHAPRIVVQMFTEEKRLEMDLEGLWETRLKRRDDKAERKDRKFEQEMFETSMIEEEIERPEAREGMSEVRPMSAIAAS
ncbi:ATPase synthesis protein 25 mitochondrial [Knufia fluminis]|uniref:ATPase synthesis protein 25 n=1 Tax=Knufia fluminis TaxID=191047 RepID=A0AAN8EHA7_9EURO|nr:ATPase synthesis protein 25 mitochondrial [Knufia fluminis]